MTAPASDAPGAAHEAAPARWEAFRDRFGTVGGFVQHGYLYAPEPLKTGITPFDALTGGIRPGVTVIGGEPGAGKSAMALQMAANVALAGSRVLYVSLEMDYQQCAARVASYASTTQGDPLKPFSWSRAWETARAARHRIDQGTRDGRAQEVMHELSHGGDPVITAARFMAESMPGLAICADGSAADIERFEATAATACDLGARLVVLDYLQLLQAPGLSDYERTGAVSKALTALATAHGVPFVVLSSLSRDGGRSPDMHAYRGSGQIEYDAGLAVLLTKGDGPGAVALHVVKNRHGECRADPYPLEFDGAHNRFTWGRAG